tara:strand:- start:176 stop:400 length:225 start_codon:yes stop_codon:yes gene_type:complete
MRHLVKLALAIKAAQIRNAEDFLNAASSEKKIISKEKNKTSTSPTEEEQRESERGAYFGESIDLSIEPSTEYLN